MLLYFSKRGYIFLFVFSGISGLLCSYKLNPMKFLNATSCRNPCFVGPKSSQLTVFSTMLQVLNELKTVIIY